MPQSEPGHAGAEERHLGAALRDSEEAMPGFAHWLYAMMQGELGDRVIDAGAGIGTYSDLMVADGRTVVALEPEDEFVGRLRARFAAGNGVTVLQADLAAPEGLPTFPLADSAICLNVLEHIEDDVGALRNLRARIEPGGRLIALVPAYPALFNGMDRSLGHHRRYSRRRFLETLTAGGWEVERAVRVNAFGVLGWFLAGSVLRRRSPGRDLVALYDRLLPVFAAVERTFLRGAFGLSILALSRRGADVLPGDRS